MKEMILYRFRVSTHKYRVVFASRFQGISREIISFLFISLFRCLYTEYPRELDPEIDAGSAKKSRTFLVLEELWSGAQSRWAGWRGRSLRIQSGKEQCCERREPVDPLDRAGGWRTEPEGDLTANAEILSCWYTGDVSGLENTVGRSIQGQSVCSFFYFSLSFF